MQPQPVLSRHRLPRAYRYVLAALWVAPALILLVSLIIARGILKEFQESESPI